MTETTSTRFLVTVDTEGDNLWSRPREITTENSRYLPRFQELCEHYGLRPTWLTNFEMACCPIFREFANDVVQRNTGEIGMHLHAWNTPPLVSLTNDDCLHQPFLIEYPENLMREKIGFLTNLLRDTFETEITSHRAGRWAFDARYARLLAEAGYTVDSSVTPNVSWRHMSGVPDGCGGSDYREFPSHAYFLNLEDISQAGSSDLLEIPMTIQQNRQTQIGRLAQRTAQASGVSLLRRAADRMFPNVVWLRPDGRNLRQMLALLEYAIEQRADYVQFMLHSSELMPGGSPRFSLPAKIERLYRHIEALFEAARPMFLGATLREFFDDVSVHNLHSTSTPKYNAAHLPRC